MQLNLRWQTTTTTKSSKHPRHFNSKFNAHILFTFHTPYINRIENSKVKTNTLNTNGMVFGAAEQNRILFYSQKNQSNFEFWWKLLLLWNAPAGFWLRKMKATAVPMMSSVTDSSVDNRKLRHRHLCTKTIWFVWLIDLYQTQNNATVYRFAESTLTESLSHIRILCSEKWKKQSFGIARNGMSIVWCVKLGIFHKRLCMWMYVRWLSPLISADRIYILIIYI